MKSKRETAGLIALIVGILGVCSGSSLGVLNGVHFLYIGGEHTKKGVIYLVSSIVCLLLVACSCLVLWPLCIVPLVFNVLSIIDGCKMLGMSDEEFEMTYGGHQIY